MTYEEFKALAHNPPQPQGVDSIFELKGYYPVGLPDRKRQHYPQYDLWSERSAFYHTLAEAEEAIRMRVSNNVIEEPDDKYYSFIVKEWQMATLSHNESNMLSWHLYDGEGNLRLHSLAADLDCDVDRAYTKFRGRAEETIAFKEGDIVEVADYRSQEVRLAVIIGTPIDIDWCWDYRKRISKSRFFNGDADNDKDIDEYYSHDESDDSYIVIDGPGPEWHHHEPAYFISAPRYPIPPYMQKKLRHNYQRYLEKCAEFEKQYNAKK